MRLVGVYISPFVRRVGIALHQYGFAFERVPASTTDGREVISGFNPLTRVPALELDSGEVLIDSHQILAELDRMAGEEGTLGPRHHTDQRAYGQMIALCTGALEKCVAGFYEIGRRPPEKVWPEWAQVCFGQAVGGVREAERRAEAGDNDGYLFDGRLTHADTAAALAYRFCARVAADQVNPETTPRLAALTAGLEATQPFADTAG